MHATFSPLAHVDLPQIGQRAVSAPWQALRFIGQHCGQHRHRTVAISDGGEMMPVMMGAATPFPAAGVDRPHAERVARARLDEAVAAEIGTR
ncbi:hypothetical protein [Accumulibacter sp.]|uniref:hypothetical protein n=1 Tax=Accumulibacter sp. TaxID=2053492 RepID=UPI0028C4FDE4|nr:hypothetical protein [Accumulibacter sp.]